MIIMQKSGQRCFSYGLFRDGYPICMGNALLVVDVQQINPFRQALYTDFV